MYLRRCGTCNSTYLFTQSKKAQRGSRFNIKIHYGGLQSSFFFFFCKMIEGSDRWGLIGTTSGDDRARIYGSEVSSSLFMYHPLYKQDLGHTGRFNLSCQAEKKRGLFVSFNIKSQLFYKQFILLIQSTKKTFSYACVRYVTGNDSTWPCMLVIGHGLIQPRMVVD